jgi:hypothetical protein
MSDTPETDVQELVHSVSGAKLHCVDVEFARKLERERDEARDTVLRLRKQRAIARNFGEQMERERDEARMESAIFEKETRRLVETLAAKRAAEMKEEA